MSFGFGVGDIIALSGLVSKVRKRFVDSPDEYRAISDEVKNLSNVLRDLEDAFPERDLTTNQEAHLCDLISGCQAVLNELENLIDKYCILDANTSRSRWKPKRQWKRLTWDSDEVKELRSRITSNIILLNAFNGNITGERVGRLAKSQDDQERQIITDWLSPTNFPSQQSDFFSRRQEGTGKWLLESEEFKTWLDEKGKTLFCPGIPGAGKTIIASIVIDFLRNKFQADDVGVAFMYCNYKSKQEQSFKDFMLSFIKQLVQERPILPVEVQTLHQHHSGKGTRPSIDEVTDVLRSLLASYSRVFLVIDALDECAKSDREQLLETLAKVRFQVQMNLFATSRPLPDIVAYFHGNVSLEIRAKEEDVRRYLENHILKLPSFVARNLGLQNEIATQIINVVDGMFLLAQLHLDSLKFKTTTKAIKTALKELPRGPEALDATYNETIERIEAQPKEHRDLAKNVFSLITYAKRPLNIPELQHALAVEAGESEIDKENFPEIEDIFSVCAGLLTIDQESSLIRLVHYTTQEYFERICRSWNGQAYIATVCITYISLEAFVAGRCHTIKKLEAMMSNHVFLNYAAQYWGFHAHAALNETVKSLAISFLNAELNVSCLSNVLLSLDDEWRWSHDDEWRWSHSLSDVINAQASAIHLVVHFELEELLPLLLENGHSLDSKDIDNRTPLSWAAERGNEAAVKLLIEQHAVRADSIDNFGRTPLLYAARNGYLKIVELLVRRDDVNADSRNESGRTPLFEAALGGHQEIMELLVKRNDVNANSRDNHDQTTFSYIVARGYTTVVESMLKGDNVEADSKDTYGRTPLLYAAKIGYEAIVKILMKRDDVKADSKDNDDRTPLSYAAENGHEAIVKILMKRDDVKADSKDDYDRTPLSYAAENGHEAIVNILAERDDVETDSKDIYGQTPLAWAALRGKMSVMQLLIACGDVDVNSKDDIGSTPLYDAASCGNQEVVDLLMTQKSVADDKNNVFWCCFFGIKNSDNNRTTYFLA